MPLLLTAVISIFNYVNVPTAEMREQPNTESEIVSQAYYSEPVNIIEDASEWVKIETTVDHYQGWAKRSALCQKAEAYPSNSAGGSVTVNRCAAHVYHAQDTVYGPIVTLPFESALDLAEPASAPDSRWLKVKLIDGREGYIQRGDVTFRKTSLNRNEMCLWALRFLDLPYTWGGRSSFGYDCSGFTQMLYRQMGSYLPRDSKDQMHWEGFTAITMEKLKAGDLIFFGLAEDKIRHVGLSIGDDRFIHSTVAENAPYVRISRLSDAEWNGSGRFAYRAARTLKIK